MFAQAPRDELDVAASRSLRPAVVAVVLALAALAVVLQGRGLTDEGLQALAALLAVGSGLVGAGLVLAIAAELPRASLRSIAITSLPLVGVAVTAFAGFADALAAQRGDPRSVAPLSAASLVSRLVFMLLLPGVVWVLSSSREDRWRRAGVAALVASAFLAVVEAAPGLVLSGLLDRRNASDAELLRLMAPAAVLAAGALLLAGVLASSSRLPWVWSALVLGTASFGVLFALGSDAVPLAWAALALHAAFVSLLGFHARRLRRDLHPAAILIFNWRDTGHPEAGGSEVFVREVASRLAMDRGVTMFCARYPGAPKREVVDGVNIVRRGSRRSVYLWALLYHLGGRLGHHDVVVDIQNGVPFLSTLYCSRPSVVLVHHVHHEQWRMVFTPAMARVGWWIESRLSPRIYRGARYITVSEASRRELGALGVSLDRITVVRNGVVRLPRPEADKTPYPLICVLSRLVPHKRVEWVLHAMAQLRKDIPGLRLVVVGRGYWEDKLREMVERLGIAESVEFAGFVDEATKGTILARAWVLAMPSVKEGWGLAVMEAAARMTPAVGSRGAGGLAESIQDGRTGLLADDLDGFTTALRSILVDAERRLAFGRAAQEWSSRFRWESTAKGFADVLTLAIRESEGTVNEPQPVAANVVT